MADFRGMWSAVSRSGDAKGAIRLGLASLLRPVGALVANVVFARVLGASGRGDLAAIVAALAVLETALTFGVPDVLARRGARGSLPTGVPGTLATGAVAASLIPAVLVALYCHSRHFTWPVAVATALVVPVVTATVIGRGVLLGRRAFQTLSVSLILTGVVRLIAPFVLIFVEHPTVNLALILVIAAYVVPAVPIFAGRPFAGPLASARDAWPVLRESLRIWPLYLALPLNARLDQLLLAVFVPAADLGRYAISVGITDVPLFLAAGPRDVVLTRVAKSRSFARIPGITFAIVVTGVVSGALSAFFAAPLLAAVFGTEFRSASLVLGILLAASALDIGAGFLTRCLIGVGRGTSASMCYILGLCVTVIVLPTLLLLGGGTTSAAVTSLASSACTYLLALSSLRRFSRSEGFSRLNGGGLEPLNGGGLEPPLP